MSITTVADLLNLLRECHLLEPAQFAEVKTNFGSAFNDPRLVAKELVKRSWLTPYQVNEIFVGRGHGLLLGSYVLLEKLGEGGMGAVFKARNWKLGRIVALKLIRKDRLENSAAVQRFQREIRAAAHLDHPNIVHAHDADQVGNVHFFVMEYVDATDLAKLVKKHGPLSVVQACDAIRQAALGLQHAFERGLVHRDIKPHNLLLTEEGVVKILDMGLARFSTSEESVSTLTEEGTVMGTIDYMAPEQALDSHHADIRADLYSLGCTFHYLLCGNVVFPGGTATEKLLKHQQVPPRPVEELCPETPAAVSAVIRRLLAKRPEERYQTPIELATALEQVQAALLHPSPSAVSSESSLTVDWRQLGGASTGETPRPIHVEPGRIGRPRWLIGIAAGVVLTLALVGVIIWLASGSREGSNPENHSTKSPGPTSRTPPATFTNSIGMKFVLVPGGTFWMSENDKNAQKQLEIPHDFYMGAHEVTQEQWHTVMGNNPSHFSREGSGQNLVKDIPDSELKQFPVETVSWEDAQKFLEELNRREGANGGWLYRLPSEAEWEYSCRGGATSKEDCSFDYYLKNNLTYTLTSQLANYADSKIGRATKVGSYPENGLGLYDMHGNVQEWCQDWYQEGSSRVIRGGSWGVNAGRCRAANRDRYPPGARSSYVGFRLALVPSGK